MERDSKYMAAEQTFTVAQRSRTLDSLFRRYDIDGDKAISMEELRPVLRAGRNNPMFPSLFQPRSPRGWPLFADSEIVTDTTMRRLDLNKDWRLDREELHRPMDAQR